MSEERRRLRVLLVDDDDDFAEDFTESSDRFFDVLHVPDGKSALSSLREEAPDAVLLDIHLKSPPHGIDLVRLIHEDHPLLPIVMVSNDARVATVVKAMRAGAIWYVSKVPEYEVLHAAIERALEDVALGSRLWRRQGAALGQIVGSSPAIEKLVSQILRIAPTTLPVLIEGESGTGKELVAMALHAASPRHGRTLVAMSGADDPDDLFDSKFFGHTRGAYTGALEDRPGAFELADGSTLFIDELADLSPVRQAKLLRVMQEGAAVRMGSSAPPTVRDVRWIGATKENLEEKMVRGEFREDLYYRFSAMRLQVPSLRSRMEDLPELAQALLAHLPDTGRIIPAISRDALRPLRTYDWPGNVRELKNVLRRAAVFSDVPELTEAAVQEALDHQRRPGRAKGTGALQSASVAPADITEDSPVKMLFDMDHDTGTDTFLRLYLLNALSRRGGNVKLAAIDIDYSMSQFYKSLDKLGIERDKKRPAPGEA